MEDFLFFDKRANYNTFAIEKKRAILYEDHRSILNVLYFAKKNSLFSKIPNLIMFDYHDDAVKPRGDKLQQIIAFKSSNPSIEEFWNFVEFELNPLDDDWLITACEFDLINDAIIIGAEEYHNVRDLVDNIYNDHEGKKHEIYVLTHLDHSLGDRGELGDHISDYERVRNIIQFNKKNDKLFNSDEIYPFILDFDLDCFSCETAGYRIAWPEDVFGQRYVHNSRSVRPSPFHFLKSLIDRCSLITICREHRSCGGIGESNKILSYLDKYFFNNVLHASPYI